MKIRVIDEYNDKGHLVYAENLPGAYVRGKSLDEAVKKLPDEVERYMLWAGMETYCAVPEHTVVQEKRSSLAVEDADSDVIFDSERRPMDMYSYMSLRKLALKSAEDFLLLYQSVPDKDSALQAPRKTFYGDVPVTARQMYEHTKNVNSYYFEQLSVEVSNAPDILACRKTGFDLLEQQENFLTNGAVSGSWNEEWSLRKLLRRFIWHDRIHARAMYRMAAALFGRDAVVDPFFFGK